MCRYARGLTPVPWPSDSVSLLDASHTLADSNNVSNDLMSRNNWPAVGEAAGLYDCICMADTTCQNLDEDLSRAWALEGQLLNLEWRILLFYHDRLEGLGEGCG